MEKDVLLNKLLDGHISMKENIAKITEIVERHDKVTFPEMKADIKNTNEAVTRMESKQNEDMAKFIKEKELIYTRLKPLEEDYEARKDTKIDTKKRLRDTIWNIVEKALIFIFGGLAVLLNKLF